MLSCCDVYISWLLYFLALHGDVCPLVPAVKDLEAGRWESQRQWRDIFATEIAVRVERSYLKVITNLQNIFTLSLAIQTENDCKPHQSKLPSLCNTALKCLFLIASSTCISLNFLTEEENWELNVFVPFTSL